MPKVIRVGVWLAVVTIALSAQGCWDETQDGMTLLGAGGCRAADGGEGDPKTIAASSTEQCQAQCFTGEEPCAAVEYNANNDMCEVHREPITSFAEVQGVSCYVVN